MLSTTGMQKKLRASQITTSKKTENKEANGFMENTKPKEKAKNIEETLYERVSVEVVNKLLSNPSRSEKTTQFCYGITQNPIMLDEKNNEYYHIKSDYKFGKTIDFGRLYTKNSLQGCAGYLRRLTSDMYYHDIDMVNAFPSILVQICNKFNVKCTVLKNYVNEKDSIITQIMKDHPQLSYQDVKKMFLICMHNGHKLKDQSISSYENIFLNEFTLELNTIAYALMKMEHFKKMKNLVYRPDMDKHNKCGTFISWICQDIESKVVLAAKAFFEHRDYVVGVLVFDGLMIEKKHNNIQQSLLNELSTFCYKKTGFRMNFIEKSMKPSNQDKHKAFSQIEIQQDCATPYCIHDEIVMFDYNGTLVNKNKKLRPGLQNLTKLKKAGFKIGIWSNAEKQNINVERIERKCNIKFDLVLDKNSCERPDAQYLRDHTSLNKYDYLKIPSKRFDMTKVWLVDDTPEKIPSKERHRVLSISTWTRDPNDCEIERIVRDILLKNVVKKDRVEVDDNVVEIYPSVIESEHETEYTRRVRKIDFGNRVFLNEKRCIAINASMNMGKSHQSCAYLRREMKKDPNFKCIIVTARIQQASTVMGQLRKGGVQGFQLYNDKNTNIETARLLVIQYESLHRLSISGTFIPYNLLLIDEYRGVCNQISSPTNGNNLVQNYDTFKFLHKTSKRLLLLDAFLFSDGLCKGFLDYVFEDTPNDILYFDYKYVSLERNIEFQSSDQIIMKCKEAMKRNKFARQALIFRSKSQMKKTIEILGLNPNKVLQISSDTPDKFDPDQPETVNMEIFQNIDQFFSDNRQIQYFCFTSKVTVGADIQTFFDSIFMFASAFDGPCARDTFQMVGRFRNIVNGTIYVQLPSVLEIKDVSYLSELNRLKSRQSIAKELNQIYLKSDRELIQDKICYSTTSLMEIAAHVSYESRRDYCGDFDRLCKMQNCNVSTSKVIISTDRSKQLTEDRILATKNFEEVTKESEETSLKMIKDLTHGELVDEITHLLTQRKRGQLNTHQHTLLKFMRTANHFPDIYQKMELSDMKFCTENKAQLIACKWIQENKKENRISRELHYMHNIGGMPEECKFMQQSYEFVSEALKLAKVEDFNDEKTTFNAISIQPMAKKMEQILDHSLEYRAGRNQTNKKLPVVERAISKLRRELKAHGFELKSQKLGPKTKQVRKYHVQMNGKIKRLLPSFSMNTRKQIISGREKRKRNDDDLPTHKRVCFSHIRQEQQEEQFQTISYL